MQRLGSDLLEFTVHGKTIAAQVRKQADDSLLVSVGSTTLTVTGREEALGLRLRMEGLATVILPTLFDPSELRSEFNGKIVRYLQDDGAEVKEGMPYVELEAMKMIMPVKATASGKVAHTRGAGSIVVAGELLGSVELADPSKVTKIVAFEGDFELRAAADAKAEAEVELLAQVELALDGYTPAQEPAALVQKLFAGSSPDKYGELASAIFTRYLLVEEQFAAAMQGGTSMDQVWLTLVKANKDSLDKLAALALAHRGLKARDEIVLSTLRSIRATQDATDADLVSRLTALPAARYGEVSLLAKQTAEFLSSEPYEDRLQKLRGQLEGEADFEKLAATKAARDSQM